MKKYFQVAGIIVLASLFNSVMDQIKFHPNTSIFTLIENEYIRTWILESKVYYKEWMSPFFPFLFDMWHMAKQIMVGLFLGTISFHLCKTWLMRFALFIIYAWLWMIIHVIFYQGILKI